MESANKMQIGTAYSAYSVPLNTYIEVLDVNDKDFGLQGFVMKTVLDAGVATSIGSPVGSTNASGAKIVTPDYSDVTKTSILGRLGGIAQAAVAAGTTSYEWIQCLGLNRVAAKCTGAVAAGVQVEWTDDDTFAVLATADSASGKALVAAASGTVATGGLYIYGF